MSTSNNTNDAKKLVKFISTLSPWNLERGEQALEEYVQQEAREARIDELKQLIALHSRTYSQKVTDNTGNVYVDESHGYISKYETQERIAKLEELQKGRDETTV